MPIYKDNKENRRLKRVGMGYGKECSPCKLKKNTTTPTPSTPKPKKKAYNPSGNKQATTIDGEISNLMKQSDKKVISQEAANTIRDMLKNIPKSKPVSKKDPVIKDSGYQKSTLKKMWQETYKMKIDTVLPVSEKRNWMSVLSDKWAKAIQKKIKSDNAKPQDILDYVAKMLIKGKITKKEWQ